MNKLLCTLFAISMSFGAYSAVAGTASTDDASNIGNAESPQQMDQAEGKSSSGSMRKPMTHKSRMMRHDEAKMMDTNADGMVSKDEYMAYHEGRFGKMKQNSDGMVMMKDFKDPSDLGTTKGH